MGFDAYIELQCINTTIFDMISAFQKIGWNYIINNQIEYLPLGDNDDYNWKSETLSSNELYEIISKKRKSGEMIGVKFLHSLEKVGFDMLSSSDLEYLLSLSYYRKEMSDRSTDIGWYYNNIVVPLRKNGIVISHICFDETMD